MLVTFAYIATDFKFHTCMDIPSKIYKTISALTVWSHIILPCMIVSKELIISFSSAVYMNFLQWNLSPLFLFSHTTNIRMNWRSVEMNVALTNVSVYYCTAFKRSPFSRIQWHVASAASCLLSYLVRNICWLWWMHNGNTHPPALCAFKAPDNKLKINKLGPCDTTAVICAKST